MASLERLIATDTHDERSRTAMGFEPHTPSGQAGTNKGSRKTVATPKAKAAEEERVAKEAKKKEEAAAKQAEKAAKKAAEARKTQEAEEARKARKAKEAAETQKAKAEAERARTAERAAAAAAEAEAALQARELVLRAEMMAREARRQALQREESARRSTGDEATEAQSLRDQKRLLERAQRKAAEAKQKIADLEEANRKARREAEEAKAAAERSKAAAEQANRAASEAFKEAENLRRRSHDSNLSAEEGPWRPSADGQHQHGTPWSEMSDVDDDAPLAPTGKSDRMEPPQGSSKTSQKILADKIRKLHPEYSDWPDEYLAAQPLDVLIRARREMTNAETARPGKKLEAKHHANFAKAKANPTVVKEGLDNRSDILHSARFLPGAAVPGQQLWLQARKEWGQDGVDPICNYDLTLVGIAGTVTAKGMDALHNPGNEDISVKMFTVSNVVNARSGVRAVLATGEDTFETFDTWKEMNDINELREAFRKLMKVAQMIRPWDYSFMVIEAWLIPTFWLNEELKGFKRASLVGDFIDHIMQRNASNWVQEIPFLDSHQIQTQWNAWWGSRRAIAPKDQASSDSKNRGKSGQDTKSQRGNKRGGSRGGGGGSSGGRGNRGGRRNDGQWGNTRVLPPHDKEPTEANTCVFYNRQGGCKNDSMNCAQYRSGKLVRMFHRCNHVIKGTSGQNELCKQSHPQYEH